MDTCRTVTNPAVHTTEHSHLQQVNLTVADGRHVGAAGGDLAGGLLLGETAWASWSHPHLHGVHVELTITNSLHVGPALGSRRAIHLEKLTFYCFYKIIITSPSCI